MNIAAPDELVAGCSDTGLVAIVRAVIDAATQLRASAQTLASIAVDVGRQADEATLVARKSSDEARLTVSAAQQMVESAGAITAEVARQTEVVDRACASARQGATAMATLASSTNDIGAIVTLINGIAGQTSLLALNARIEAARAGEAGRGFSVVANEVKSLSEQTTQATHNIDLLIGGVRHDVADTSQSLDASVARFTDAGEVAALVAVAAAGQRSAADQVETHADEAAAHAESTARTVGRLATTAAAAGVIAGQITCDTDALIAEMQRLEGAAADLPGK